MEEGGYTVMHRWLFLTAACFCLLLPPYTASTAEQGVGHIRGKVVTKGGEALSDSMVRFFDAKAGPSPYTLEYWRISEYRTRTAEDGSFSIQLPAGMYYVVVLKKSAESESGNPGEGDLIFPPADEREQKQYIVKAGETVDIGMISGAVPFRKEWTAQGKTGIEGRVLDKHGRPVEGARVYAHTQPGKEIPLFGSDRKSGRNGRYLVRVPEGGRYYLIVSGYRNPEAVTVTTGKMTQGIDISLPESP